MWCVSVELPDGPGIRPRKVVCRKSKAKAIAVLREMNAELAEHGDIVQSMTLAEWLDYWLENIDAPRSRPRTQENHRTHIEKWIVPSLGRRPLMKLTPPHIRQLHKTMRDEGKSSGHVKNVHATLKVALADAVRERRLRQNPCDMMDRPRSSNRAQKALTVEQSVQLLAHLATREDRALWACFILTGARRGEVLGLEDDRIGETLVLSWQLQRITDISKAPEDWEHRHVEGTLYLARPKSKSGWRVIPLVEPLRSILALHMQGRGPGLVFTEDDGRPIPPDIATRRWKQLLAEAGLPEDVVLHGSRHTVADLLKAAGVRTEDIQQILGHSSRAMTTAYFTKDNLPELEAAMHKMSALLAQDSAKAS
jgi:integrase